VGLTSRRILWLGFVAALIALAYSSRATVGKPDPDVLYRYSSAANVAVQYAVLLAVVLGIAGGSRVLLAARRPLSWPRAARLASGVFLGIYVTSAVLDHYLHAGREQGLTPSHGEAAHAGQYAANFVMIALVAPVVEELTYRGLGYTLLERWGRWTAILATGLLFGLSHGLVEGLPVLTIFGIGLGWLRSRIDSVYPGMVVHGVFNGLALILAVTI
jgi:membrane protease YdiL (CAAX protease family)